MTMLALSTELMVLRTSTPEQASLGKRCDSGITVAPPMAVGTQQVLRPATSCCLSKAPFKLHSLMWIDVAQE